MRLLLHSLVGFLLTSTMVFAQGRPDFTGTWVMDPARSETAAQGPDASPRAPVKLVIAPAPNGVSIETQIDGRKQTVIYSFDKGTLSPHPPTPNAVGANGSSGAGGAFGTNGAVGTSIGGTTGTNESTVEHAIAEYKDGHLMTTMIYRVNGMAMTRVEDRSLSANGREMKIETLVKVEHGYELGHQDAKTYTVVKDVYMR